MKRLFVGAFLAILAGAALAILCGAAVWCLWNWLMPQLFGLPRVTIVEAFGLTLLGHLLFGGLVRVSVGGDTR